MRNTDGIPGRGHGRKQAADRTPDRKTGDGLREELTVGKLLAETVERFGQRTAVEYLGRRWSYLELDGITNRLAAAMLIMDFQKGSKAGIWANDRPNTLFCLLALLKIGAVPVMLNTSWTPGEVEKALEKTETEYLFYDEGYRGQDFAALSEALKTSHLKGRWFLGETVEELLKEAEGWRREAMQQPGFIQAAGDSVRLEESLLQKAREQVRPQDVDMILFTSGSTGSPKGVVTTHFSRCNNGIAQARMLRATEEDIYLVAIPIFHCFSMCGNLMAALATGACICFPKSRKTIHLLEAAERAKATVLTAVPTLFSALLANGRRREFDLSALKKGLIGGAGCSPVLLEQVCREFQMELLPSLGQTEATAGITAGSFQEPVAERALHAGYLIPHLEPRIVDLDTGEPLPAGQTGEFCIRGYSVMECYYGEPELTEEAIDAQGFLHTGDMGYLDGNGRLFLTGRKKELIIRGGENVAPGEIEAVLRKEPRIRQVKVIGLPDDHYGEEICACVVAGEEALTAEEVRSLAARKLAYYKVPRYVVFLEELPLLGNGKTDIKKLRQSITFLLTQYMESDNMIKHNML